MNSSVYACAGSLCVTLVACAVIRMIAPSGNTSRILSVVISVFVLCSMISPIITLVKTSDFNVKEERFSVTEDSLSAEYNEVVINQTADYINEYLNTSLEASGVEKATIKTVLALDKNDGIYINNISIYIDKKYTDKAGEIKNIVKNTVGVEPIVLER